MLIGSIIYQLVQDFATSHSIWQEKAHSDGHENGSICGVNIEGALDDSHVSHYGETTHFVGSLVVQEGIVANHLHINFCLLIHKHVCMYIYIHTYIWDNPVQGLAQSEFQILSSMTSI